MAGAARRTGVRDQRAAAGRRRRRLPGRDAGRPAAGRLRREGGHFGGAVAQGQAAAVVAAKIDFDATDENRTDNRGEDKRRAEQFFRIEASVGMD